MSTDAIEHMKPIRRPGGITVWQGPRPEDELNLGPRLCAICGDNCWGEICHFCQAVNASPPRLGPCADCGKPCRGKRCRTCHNDGHRATQPASVRRRELRAAAKRAAGRLSPEDRAWCERQAADHFWQAWERANRADQANPLQPEAVRRARHLQIGATCQP
jgi:hypothetical protein